MEGVRPSLADGMFDASVTGLLLRQPHPMAGPVWRERRSGPPADGRFATDHAGLYLALGEAVNGPGGYFGAGPDSLADCLRGGFGATVPFTVVWRSARFVETTHWDTMVAVLNEAGVTVTFA